jgi:DNA modification methylase
MLADNKLTLNAEWDLERLAIEIAELRASDFDISLIGFSESEIEDLLRADDAGLTDPEEAPEPPADPVSELGDVWLLGQHRLVCGDCTDAGVVGTALAAVKPHLMVTDPPYGVRYDPNGRTRRHGDKWQKVVARGKIDNDDRADWQEAFALFTGDIAYVWYASVLDIAGASLRECGFDLRSQIVWVKENLVFSRCDYHRQLETCWYAVRSSGKGNWTGDRKQTTVWQIGDGLGCVRHPKDATGHGTQKPVECMKRPIENNSSPGQAVYDPFVGSGTTIIAAEMTGRACHAIELHPPYVDVSVLRWQNFTGKQATLEATGETFEATEAARAREDRIDVAIAKKRIAEIEANGVKSPGSVTSATRTARASKAKAGVSPAA